MGSVNPPKNRDYSDKTRIDLNQSYQVAYWKERFGVSERELSEAVLAAMPAASVFRPSVMFGPEDDFFNKFAAMARMLPALPLIGGGETRFQPAFVGDVAEAIAEAITIARGCSCCSPQRWRISTSPR